MCKVLPSASLLKSFILSFICPLVSRQKRKQIEKQSPLKVNRRFGPIYRLHLQGRKINRARNQRESRWQAWLTFNGLHGIISQKMVLFIITAVRTSNPTDWEVGYCQHTGISLKEWKQPKPITVTAQSKARNVFACSNTRSWVRTPVEACMSALILRLFCVGSGLVTGRSLVQEDP
jgi:hypothetical protein